MHRIWQHNRTQTLKLSTTLLSISSGIHLISLLLMSSLVCGLFSKNPSGNSQAGWDLGNRMARGYRFDNMSLSHGSYTWGIQVFWSRNEVAPHFSNRTLGYLRHNFPCANSFRVKPITRGHPIPKISTRLTIFWGGTWKKQLLILNW